MRGLQYGPWEFLRQVWVSCAPATILLIYLGRFPRVQIDHSRKHGRKSRDFGRFHTIIDLITICIIDKTKISILKFIFKAFIYLLNLQKIRDLNSFRNK